MFLSLPTCRTLLPLLLCSLALARVALTSAPPKTATFHSFASAVPHWAARSALAGLPSSDHPIHFSVHLSWNQSEELESFAQKVSTPTDKLYGKHLSPEEFRARFSPSEESVQEVATWLKENGLKVVSVGLSRKYLLAEGTIKQAEVAFRTTFGLYSVKGQSLRAPQSAPSVPLSLVKSGVINIMGLDQGWLLKPRGIKNSFDKSDENSFPQAAASTKKCTFDYVPNGLSNKTLCGYTTAQLRKAYGIPSRLSGINQSIAIIGGYSSPFMQNDLNIWSEQAGINSTLITLISPDYNYSYPEVVLRPSASFNPRWQLEESLDIETIHGIAPKTSIFYFGTVSAAFPDFFAAISAVLDYGLASIISNSYIGVQPPPSYVPAADTLAMTKPFSDILVQAAVQGVGVYFASGDNGDESTSNLFGGLPTTGYPASDPWAIAVGGTSLAIDKKGRRIFEVYWGTSIQNATGENFVYGGGGGVSSIFPLPFYQKRGPAKTFLDKYGKGVSGRVVPDISADGDPVTGLLIGFSVLKFGNGTGYFANDQFYQPVFENSVAAGTSMSCPMMAAFVALTQELTGRKFGFINPLLYSLPSSAFNDIVKPKKPIRVGTSRNGTISFAQTFSLSSVSGYDDSTGLGVPSYRFWSKAFWRKLPTV